MKKIVAAFLAVVLAVPSWAISPIAARIIAGGYRPAPVPDILWVKFTDGSGGTATATVGPNLTLTNATWTADSFGRTGRATLYNGTTAFAKTASAVTYGAKVITLCAWLYWDTNANTDNIFLESSANYNSNDQTFAIAPNDSTTLRNAGALHNTGGNYRVRSFTRASAAAWHHIAWVLDNNTAWNCTAYVDGVAQSMTSDRNNTSGNTNFSAQTLNIMARGGASLFAAGRVADLRIYGRALTTAEISRVMLDAQ